MNKEKIKLLEKAKNILNKVFGEDNKEWDKKWCKNLGYSISSLNLAISQLKKPNKINYKMFD